MNGAFWVPVFIGFGVAVGWFVHRAESRRDYADWRRNQRRREQLRRVAR